MTPNRIRFLRKKRGLTQPDMAKSLGISQSLLSLIENGGREITPKMQDEIASILNVTLDDLFKLTENQPVNDLARIEMLDVKACCGTGNDVISENVIGTWNMPIETFKNITNTGAENVKMIQVYGDSMEPTLKGGDWVLVDITRNTPDSDGLFVLWLTTGLAVKRLQGGLNDITVHSDNPNYKDINAKMGEIRIIGKVIYTLEAKRVG